MSYLWDRNNQNETKIEIYSVEEFSNITYYLIRVRVGEISWNLKHRYSEFYNLNNNLIIEHGISKDHLPAKRVIGNKSNEFIELRRQGLEKYLQRIFVYLKRTMPKVFVQFLDFHLYDIYFLLQEFSEKCSTESDFILTSTNKRLSITPLELYAISEFLKSPFPQIENYDSCLNLGPILDLCAQLDCLTIIGATNEYLHSNIVLNKLIFELTPLKIHNTLHLENISLNKLYSFGTLKNTLHTLEVNYTNSHKISDILQCDVLHKNTLEGSEKWTCLETLNLSNNNLVEIDQIINLAQNLRLLILDNNKISTISNLTGLPKLEELSISNNLITLCENLHTKMGNLKTLNLSQNRIDSTRGFFKLFSLEILDLSFNSLTEICELEYLRNLPCLEMLTLTGNGLSTTIIDYRIKTFEIFGDRAKDLFLDNEKASQAELDKVSILSALKIVKAGKTPNLCKLSSS